MLYILFSPSLSIYAVGVKWHWSSYCLVRFPEIAFSVAMFSLPSHDIYVLDTWRLHKLVILMLFLREVSNTSLVDIIDVYIGV